MASKSKVFLNSEILKDEKGTILKKGSFTIALGYPAPYSVGASSLGFQTVYRTLNNIDNIVCERFFLDTYTNREIKTVEGDRPVSSFDMVAFSVACETDLAKVAALLHAANIPFFAEDRNDRFPPVVIGGPLTLVDAKMAAPFADVIVAGEAEEALVIIGSALKESRDKNEFLQILENSQHGIWVTKDETGPEIYQVPKSSLPAFGATWSKNAALKDLFLIEIARGCPHRCQFCLLAGTGKYRFVDIENLIPLIPDEATGVGLVGAAVTDHPALEEIVEKIVLQNKRVSLSSMRADRITENLLMLLKKGGLQRLTVAADGSSQSIRDNIKKGIKDEDLINAALLAKKTGLQGMKIYSMVGLPDETFDDVKEFTKLLLELSKIISISVAVQSFVPKPNTPLCNAEMFEIKDLKERLSMIKKEAGKRVAVMPSSPKWSWIDWKLCNGGRSAAKIAVDAYKNKETFAAWKEAINKHL
ncbi:MAG: radical SAM protein [Deltaproteobacteria bacterium]|nr:radical SAM protein [Deltaproteobacteria bacterium]